MKATTYRSERDRCDIVELTVDDKDKASALNSRELMREVRDVLAREIAGRIMDRLAPAIDKALASIIPEQPQ